MMILVAMVVLVAALVTIYVVANAIVGGVVDGLYMSVKNAGRDVPRWGDE